VPPNQDGKGEELVLVLEVDEEDNEEGGSTPVVVVDPSHDSPRRMP